MTCQGRLFAASGKAPHDHAWARSLAVARMHNAAASVSAIAKPERDFAPTLATRAMMLGSEYEQRKLKETRTVKTTRIVKA